MKNRYIYTLLLIVGLGSSVGALAKEKAAYFEMTDGSAKSINFVITSEDPKFIAQARKILAGKYKGADTTIMGTVIPKRAPYNKKWNFHLKDPVFFEMAIELCDARASYVSKNLNMWVKSVGNWCPWGSSLVKEVKIKK
jgi:hypothetical protein